MSGSKAKKQTTPTLDEWHQYKQKYLLDVQQSSNEDMDTLFNRANEIGQKITSTLITVAGLALTMTSGILATGDISLSYFAKIVFAVGVTSLFLSILAGLWALKAAKDFHLVWARAKHARGGMVERAKIETYDDLEAFRAEIMAAESKLPEQSKKHPDRLQFIFFAIGMLATVLIIGAALFDF